MKTNLLFFAACLAFWLPAFSICSETVDRIAAKVGSDVITVSDSAETLIFKKKIFNLKYGPVYAALSMQPWKNDTLGEIILETLLKQKIAADAIVIAPPELEAAYQAQWQGSGSERAWIEQLQKAGLTPEEYKNDLRFEMQKQKFIQKNILPKITVPDSDLQAAYEKQKNNFQTFNKYRFVEALLVQSQFASEAEFKKTAQSIQQGLKNQAAGVGEQIQKYSSGAFKNSRGDSGVMAGQDINPEIKALLDHLKNGETSQIFYNGGQAYIFKLVQKSEPRLLPFAQVAPALKMQLTQSAIDDELRKYLMAEKDRTYVEIVKAP